MLAHPHFSWHAVAVEMVGELKWSKIAEYVPTRSDVQCRERYFNRTMATTVWSRDEKRMLLSVTRRYNFKWSKIARVCV
jgi:myb proto-oncogene protein